MNDAPIRQPAAPVEWLEAIAEGEADLAAGRIVPGEQVMRELRESLARLEGPDNGCSQPAGPGST